MTDIEKLKKLFDEFGVSYKHDDTEACLIITCECGDNKIAGYIGFHTNFCFDLEGKFIEMGAYE